MDVPLGPPIDGAHGVDPQSALGPGSRLESLHLVPVLLRADMGGIDIRRAGLSLQVLRARVALALPAFSPCRRASAARSPSRSCLETWPPTPTAAGASSTRPAPCPPSPRLSRLPHAAHRAILAEWDRARLRKGGDIAAVNAPAMRQRPPAS